MKVKARLCLLAFALLGLVSCQAPPARNSASFYYPSTQRPATAPAHSATGTAASTSTAPVPRGGYAPGSGPTAMPGGGTQYMEQYRESGPFGSYSGTTVIQSTGGVQSYQTIGSTPVYPGSAVPGYLPNQPYYGPRTSQQPVFVPGTAGNSGYYINPSTGARVSP